MRPSTSSCIIGILLFPVVVGTPAAALQDPTTIRVDGRIDIFDERGAVAIDSVAPVWVRLELEAGAASMPAQTAVSHSGHWNATGFMMRDSVASFSLTVQLEGFVHVNAPTKAAFKDGERRIGGRRINMMTPGRARNEDHARANRLRASGDSSDVAEAVRLYERAYSWSEDPTVLESLADLYEDQGDFARCAERFGDAASGWSDSVKIRVDLRRSLICRAKAAGAAGNREAQDATIQAAATLLGRPGLSEAARVEAIGYWLDALLSLYSPRGDLRLFARTVTGDPAAADDWIEFYYGAVEGSAAPATLRADDVFEAVRNLSTNLGRAPQ